MRLQAGGGTFELDARQSQTSADVTASVKGVELKTALRDFTGKLDANLQMQGEGATLTGRLDAKVSGAKGVGAESGNEVDATARATLADGRLELVAQASGSKGMSSSLSLVLPVEASAAPLRLAIVRNRPMAGRFLAEGEIGPLWDLVYGGDRQLGGQAHINSTLGGTLADPQITGEASVVNGRLEDAQSGLVLTGLSATAQLKRDVVTLTSFSAKDENKGQITGSGSVSLMRGGGSSLKLDLKEFRLVNNDTAEATATGPVTLTRTPDGKVTIQGSLLVNRAQINAEARLRPSIVTMAVVEKNLPEQLKFRNETTPGKASPVALDVKLHAPRGIFVKGRGVDLELSLDAQVSGDIEDPNLSGTAGVVRGSYDFAGKRFDFDERGYVRLSTNAEKIRLDLSASWEGPSLTATVLIKGTAAKPEITLTSAPSLPREEILSQVLFGSSAAQLSGAETAELASTVTAMATGGGFDVLGGLRQFAGLDRLALGGDAASGTTIAGGKYIGPNVYLEIVGGGRQGPTAEVDWRIKRGFSIISQVGQTSGAKLAIRWSHDVGKPKDQQAKSKPGG